MLHNSEEIILPSLSAIRKLLEPINSRLDRIDMKLQTEVKKEQSKRYYRNKDIKDLLGISNNTIIKYRETGLLPYTKLGDVYLYDMKVIDMILEKNKVC